jgi:hypothetical protein
MQAQGVDYPRYNLPRGASVRSPAEADLFAAKGACAAEGNVLP